MDTEEITGYGGFLQPNPTRSCSPRRRRRRRKRRRDRSNRRRNSQRRNSLRRLLSQKRRTRRSDLVSPNLRTLIWNCPRGKRSSFCGNTEVRLYPSVLPISSFNLDQFKRVYSNEDTLTKAVPFFWENFDKEGWSIWHASYNYTEDLKFIFMTSNLVSGMFQRLDKLRKFAFASVLILGEDNNNTISGVWVMRGQKLAFEVGSPGHSQKLICSRP